jgi:hypothetical protein
VGCLSSLQFIWIHQVIISTETNKLFWDELCFQSCNMITFMVRILMISHTELQISWSWGAYSYMTSHRWSTDFSPWNKFASFFFEIWSKSGNATKYVKCIITPYHLTAASTEWLSPSTDPETSVTYWCRLLWKNRPTDQCPASFHPRRKLSLPGPTQQHRCHETDPGKNLLGLLRTALPCYVTPS